MPGSDSYSDSAPPLGVDASSFAKPTTNAVPDSKSITTESLGLLFKNPTVKLLNGKWLLLKNSTQYSSEAEAKAELEKIAEPLKIRKATIDNLTTKILQQSTYDKWTGQGFGSIYANAQSMATRLADAGITRLEDFGQRSVTTQEYYSDESGYVPVTKTEFFNKATGQVIKGDGQGGSTFDKTFAGDGSTTFNVTFNEMGMPIFYTQYGGDTSDWGSVAPFLAFASIIPSPIQPFAAALNAVAAFKQGNTVGGILSALGAAYSFGAQYSNLNPSALDYVNQMDLASDAAAGASSASSLTQAANWFATNASTIQTAQQAVGLLNALDKKNLAGIIGGLTQLSPEIGVTIPESAMKAIQTAAVGAAMSKGDWAGAALAAGTLTNSSDLRLAGKAINVVNAANSGNQQAMLTSFVSFAQDAGLGSSAVKDASRKLGAPMSDKIAADAYNSADPDAHVKEFYNVLGQVKNSYKQNFGEEPSADMLASFADNGGILDGYNAYVQNKNTTNQSELEAMLSKAGLTTKDLNPDSVFQALSLTERSAQDYVNQLVDIRKNSFNGSGYDSKEAAAAAAIKAGFNTFTAPDGETYNVMPGEVAKKIIDDAKGGKNVGIDTSTFETFKGVPLKEFDSIDDIPEIVITATKLDKPSPSDAEAWAAYQKELKDLGGASFSKFFKDQLDILTEAFKGTKPDTFANAMKNALAFGARNFGSLSSNLLRGAEAFGLDKNSAALRTSQALERWGKTNQSSGILDAEEQFTNSINSITKESLAAKLGTTPDKVSSLQVAAEQMRELGRQAVKNPLGTFSVALGEAAQEVPFLVASGGVGSIASKVLSKAGAFAVARGTDAALNGYESFSGNYAEVKDYLAKNGYSDSKSEARAVASGLEAMGITMLTSWVGDKAIVRSFMGDVAGSSVANIVGAGAKEYVMGYVEGGLQNASAQIGKYGEVRNMAEVTAAGTIEGFVQSGLTTGVLSADKLSQVVARDYDGKGVTLKSILDGTSTFDPGSMNSNFELTAGFTIGDAVNYNKTFTENPNITPVEYMKTAEFFRAEGLTPTLQNIAAVVGGETDLTSTDLQKAATTYADQNYVTSAEAKQMLTDLGYQNPTQAQIDQFVGNKVEATTKTDITNWVSQNTVTRDEAIQTLKDLGYVNPTDTLINKLVGQYDQSQLQTKAEGLGIATKQDILDAIAKINLPTGLTKDDVAASIAAYMKANPGLSIADVSSNITEATKGLATAADTKAAIADALKGYATKSDIETAIAGIKFPAGLSKDDVATAISDYMKANPGFSLDDVATKITEATKGLATTEGTKTAIADALKGYATTQDIKDAIAGIEFPAGITKEDVTTAIADYMKANPGLSLEDVASKITEATKDLATTEGTKTAIADALKGYATTQDIKDAIAGIEFPAGLSKDDVATAIADYMDANPGLSLDDVATKIADATKGLATTADTKTAIADALKGYATTQDIKDAIAGIEFPAGLSKDDVATAIADYMDANPGLTAEDVTKSITDYMTANPGLTAADLDTAISAATKDLATTAQLTDLQNSLAEEIQAAKDIGLKGDAAIQAGLDSLAEKVGTNQADLLTQLETTAADLKAQFATDITAAQEATAKEIADTKTALETAIADAKAAGLEGDEALKAAIDAVAADQETNAADLLAKLGTTEANLKAEFETGLAGVSTEVADTRKALEDAIQAAKDIGLEGDAALQAGIDSVAAELGTTKEALLTQLGTTEETLRTEFATGISGLETQMKEQYDALTTEQKALADALTAQGTTLADAIAAAQESTEGKISDLEARTNEQYNTLTAAQKATADNLLAQGKTLQEAIDAAKAETATKIGELSADLQAKYDSLTTEQKALADTLAQQGVDLRTAIDAAAQQTQQQVADLGASLNQRVDQLMKQGLDQYTATQQAISEVTQQNQQLQKQIGTQAKTATQQDIDALTQMLSGQRSVDLAYDVTGDKQITQADIDFLSQVVSGQKQGWTAPAGSPWAATGLYGQIAASEAQRQADLQAQELQRQNDIKAQIARENEAARQSAIRTTAGQAAGQVQSLINQLPQAAKAAQTTTTPIYAGEMTPFDLGSPLDVGFFSPSKEKQTSQPGQQATKIASGGYLDDLLDLLR